MPKKKTSRSNINLDEIIKSSESRLVCVYIDGLLSLSDFMLPLINKFLIIVGPNDVGKTAILRGLGMLEEYSKSRNPSVEVGLFHRYGNNVADSIKICLVYEVPRDKLLLCDSLKEFDVSGLSLVENCYIGACLIMIPHNDIGNREYFEKVKVSISKKYVMFRRDMSPDNGNLCSSLTYHEELELKLSNINDIKPSIFVFGVERNLEDEYKRRGVLGNIMKEVLENLRERELNKHLSELKGKIQEHVTLELDRYIKKIFERYDPKDLNGEIKPVVEDFNLEDAIKWELYVRDPYAKIDIPLSSKGHGIQSIVYIELLREIMSERSKPGSDKIIVAVDEPENHLHPKLLHKLYDSLRKLSELDNYVVMVTHSPMIINNTRLDNIYYAYRDENGRTRLKTLSDEKDLEQIYIELDVSLADILGANTIILVEGKNDRIFVERLITSNLSIPVKIIEMRGASEAARLTSVLVSIAKKYTRSKIIVLLDRDEYNNKKEEIDNQLKNRFSENLETLKDFIIVLPCCENDKYKSIEDLYKLEYILETLRNEDTINGLKSIISSHTQYECNVSDINLAVKLSNEIIKYIINTAPREIKHPYVKSIRKIVYESVKEVIEKEIGETRSRKELNKCITDLTNRILSKIKNVLARNIEIEHLEDDGIRLVKSLKESIKQ